jgi:hypothetical protein
MTIDGSQHMGNWGKKIPTVQESIHLTQTNKNALIGEGAHVTANIKGTPLKVHTFFDANGNFKGSDFGKR